MAATRFKTRTTAAGFTLIEVMIVVAIIGILAGVAYPAYTDHVRRGRLPEAFTPLGDFRVKMEQYYLDNKNYGDPTGTECGTGAAWSGFLVPGAEVFTFSCETDNNGQSYVITATGSPGGSVHTYTVSNTGARRTTVFKGEDVDKDCWLTKGGEC